MGGARLIASCPAFHPSSLAQLLQSPDRRDRNGKSTCRRFRRRVRAWMPSARARRDVPGHGNPCYCARFGDDMLAADGNRQSISSDDRVAPRRGAALSGWLSCTRRSTVLSRRLAVLRALGDSTAAIVDVRFCTEAGPLRRLQTRRAHGLCTGHTTRSSSSSPQPC